MASQPIAILGIGPHRDIGQRLGQAMAPHFSFCAVLTDPTKENLWTLLNYLNPRPMGVFSGGFDEGNVNSTIKDALDSWNDSNEGADVKLFVVPPNLRNQGGEYALRDWCRKELCEACGVENSGWTVQ